MLRPTTCFTRIKAWLFLPCFLTSCALIDSSTPPRIVRVKAVADRELREKDPRWQDTVRGLVDAASDIFERDFGIQFKVLAVEPWPLQETTALTAVMLQALKEKVSLNGEDLVIGFTGQRINRLRGRGRVDRIGSCREGLGNYLVGQVSRPFRYPGKPEEPETDLLLLVHELGHIFGAEHTVDPLSIMNEDFFGHGTDFDAKSRSVIAANKSCPFAKG